MFLGAVFIFILVILFLWLVIRGGFDKILGYLGYVEKLDLLLEILNFKVVVDVKFVDYIERLLNMIE